LRFPDRGSGKRRTATGSVCDSGVVSACQTADLAGRVAQSAPVDLDLPGFGTGLCFGMPRKLIFAQPLLFPQLVDLPGTLASATWWRIWVFKVLGALARGLWPCLARDVSVTPRATPKISFFI
jgi:hypothetical protein